MAHPTNQSPSMNTRVTLDPVLPLRLSMALRHAGRSRNIRGATTRLTTLRASFFSTLHEVCRQQGLSSKPDCFRSNWTGSVERGRNASAGGLPAGSRRKDTETSSGRHREAKVTPRLLLSGETGTIRATEVAELPSMPCAAPGTCLTILHGVLLLRLLLTVYF